jgi:hypothetical protein
VAVDLDGALLHSSSFLCKEYSVPPTERGPGKGSTITPARGGTLGKERVVRKNQRVDDMANEILARQARNRARRTGEPFEEALKAVINTEGGQQLGELRDGPHGEERAAWWQESLPRERAEERREERGGAR